MNQDFNANNQRSSRPINRSKPMVDGFSARPRQTPTYNRRSSSMIPSTDQEYMISLGMRASRREEAYKPRSRADTIKAKIKALKSHVLHPSNRNSMKKLATACCVFVLVLTGFTAVRSSGSVTANDDQQQLLVDNGDTPHDKQIYNQVGYSVAPDLPRFISINKLGVKSRVTRLSVRENSEPKFPQNIYDVGWYENSSKPGDAGAALLIGHIRGSEKQGVFHDLTNLVPGDEFQVELGNGEVKVFYIVKMQAYGRGIVNYAELMSTAMSGQPGLNLLTAVGAFESNAEVTQQLGIFAIEKSSFIDN